MSTKALEIKPVTIPREVADAIETLRKDSASDPAFSNEGIAHVYVTESYIGPIALFLRKIPFDTLMRALLDGYERELTEDEAREQAVLDEYETYFHGPPQYTTEEEDYAYVDGIKFTLNTLGIVIPGINDVEGGAA